MAVFLYDGSFEGFLTVLERLFSAKEEPGEISSSPPLHADLFHPPTTVETDVEAADAFLVKVGQRISRETQRTLYHTFLSEAEGMEMALYRWLELGFRSGRRVEGLLSHDRVLPVNRLVRKVRFEAHRLKGFVRFRELAEGFWYAPLSPDHAVLTLIAPHFARRFSDQNWVLHDLKRGMAAVHDAGRREWTTVPLELSGEPEASEKEVLCSELWKRYFAGVTVEGRMNRKLQDQHVPRRYRQHLTEFGD